MLQTLNLKRYLEVCNRAGDFVEMLPYLVFYAMLFWDTLNPRDKHYYSLLLDHDICYILMIVYRLDGVLRDFL